MDASDRKAVTKKAIRQTIKKLKEYQTFSNKEIGFESIDLDFYNHFLEFLTKEKDLKQSTIGSHIKNIKVFMREAFERGLTKNTTVSKQEI